jgi:hypothetical protein
MSLALLFHYLMLNMFRMLVHPSSGVCDLLWIYFMCCIALIRCVLVLRCGSAGVVWYPYAGFSLHKDITSPQPNNTVTPTHIEPEQFNTWNKSTISRKLLKMDVLTFETRWVVNSEIIKQVTLSWSISIQLSSLKLIQEKNSNMSSLVRYMFADLYSVIYTVCMRVTAL